MSGSYDQNAYLEGYPEGIDQHFWHLARNDFLLRSLQQLLGAGELVLDVGCGMGITTAFLRKNDINCRGVELGEPPVGDAVRDYIYTGTNVFELPEQLRQEVRVVLLLDVLEHIEERTQFLAQLRRALPNCRFLLLTVPARQELWSNYDDYWGHQLRYSRPGLKQELELSGVPCCKQPLFVSQHLLASAAVEFVASTAFGEVYLSVTQSLDSWFASNIGFLGGSGESFFSGSASRFHSGEPRRGKSI